MQKGNPMPILVTGGTGFIGQSVVQRLVTMGNRVVVVSRRPAPFPREIEGQIESVAADIRVFSDVMRVVCDFKIDKIIHIAYTLTAEGEANPLSAIQTNVLGTCNLFEAARVYGAKRVVFCSSIAAFAPQESYGDRLLKEEEDFMKPVSIYGATKVLNEFMAARFEKRYGLEVPLLRISAAYGTGREERGVTAWTSQLVAAVTRDKPAFVRIRSDQKASFIYVDDVAEQLVRLSLAEKLNYRCYNSGGYLSTPGDFRGIVKKYYPKAEITFDEKGPLWPYPYKLDGSRLAKEINLQLRDPESGLLGQINQERASLGLGPLKRIK
jgi:UDP-glucuronate 4-epimerase